MPSPAHHAYKMTLPPGKRQRRSIRSVDDEPAVKTRRAPPRLASDLVKTPLDQKAGTVAKKSGPKVSTKISPKSSPGKANRRHSNEEKENKSLHTFFGRATEEQRWLRKDESPLTVVEDGEAGDDIEDDSLDEALANLPDGEGEENKVLDRRKFSEPIFRDGVAKSVRNVVGSSQKFAKPLKPTPKEEKATSSHYEDVLSRPWAERFAPTSLEELSVHKKKVTDVQSWLSAVLQGRDRRVCDPRWLSCR